MKPNVNPNLSLYNNDFIPMCVCVYDGKLLIANLYIQKIVGVYSDMLFFLVKPFIGRKINEELQLWQY